MPSIISLDSETTSSEFRHGARPFFVTSCDESGELSWWEWPVDPLTRRVAINRNDLAEIQELIDAADRIVLQNARFDVRALESAFSDFGLSLNWDWAKVEDTLIAGHLLASNHPHDQTSMAIEYLATNVQPFEDRIEKVTKSARNWASRHRKDWRIAQVGDPSMPAAKTAKLWKLDMWLPRAMAIYRDLPEDNAAWTALEDYANSDSAVVLPLFKEQRKHLERRGLWKIYRERMRLLPVAHEMERHGLTVDSREHGRLIDEYRTEAARAGRVCEGIAASLGAELKLPKSGNSGALLDFCFGRMVETDHGNGNKSVSWDKSNSINLPVVKTSKKTGNPSLDKEAMDHYLDVLPRNSKAYLFVRRLSEKRKRDTSATYLDGYKRFWLPLGGRKDNRWRVIYSGPNPTGSNTLRWSYSNPNMQNASKQEGFNLRRAFGPAPGREWWSLDAKNIELRIPAYEAGEEEMINIFEHPDGPPYFGSYHILVFSILHPREFDKHGAECKNVYPELYRRTKSGNFAAQYGAIEASGTADRAYGIPGAQRKIAQQFKKIDALNKKWIRFAEQRGYVETIPDRDVDPEHGYPILVSRTGRDEVKPTVPLNYHVQGSAMWWMCRAMVNVHDYLEGYNATHEGSYRMILQVHDEIVLDFPRGKTPEENLPIVRNVQRLMERGGQGIGVPTPVGIEYHAVNWAEGISMG